VRFSKFYLKKIYFSSKDHSRIKRIIYSMGRIFIRTG